MSDQESNPIAELIDAIASGNYNESEKIFHQAISDRMQDALDAEKVNVASQIFNQLDDDDEFEDEEELEAELVEEGVQLQEANFKKAAAALEKMIKDPKFKRFYGDDIEDIENHIAYLKSSDAADHKASGRSARNLDTIIRDIVSDAVHRNSSAADSKMWHDAAGLQRMKESVDLEESNGVPTGIKIHSVNKGGKKEATIVFTAQDAQRYHKEVKKEGGKVVGHQLMYGTKAGPMQKV